MAGRHGPYTPADDARILAAFSLPPYSAKRRQATAALAEQFGVSHDALKRRAHVVRQQALGREVNRKSGRPQPKPKLAAAPDHLIAPIVARPAWMAPITRQQLMARR